MFSLHSQCPSPTDNKEIKLRKATDRRKKIHKEKDAGTQKG
jgi:hypothetical protein